MLVSAPAMILISYRHCQSRLLTEQLFSRIDRHLCRYESLANKITYCLGVLSFGLFCYLLGSSPHEIPRIYCLFFISVLPLRWMYYRMKKWHYYLLDFCYYANAISVFMLLFFPKDERLFMLCFSFSEGPLAWALIVWRCSLVFSSIDKMISVLIHLLPGTVFFILRWWDTSSNFEFSRLINAEEDVEVVNNSTIWLFFVPLMAYCIWQVLYFALVEGFRRQRILRDPEIMTSYRELKRKAQRANNIWWRISGLLGAEKRVLMYAVIQAVFTVATLLLAVPMFHCYRLHLGFEIFKLWTAVWNGSRFVFEVMPEQSSYLKAKANASTVKLEKKSESESKIPMMEESFTYTTKSQETTAAASSSSALTSSGDGDRASAQHHILPSSVSSPPTTCKPIAIASSCRSAAPLIANLNLGWISHRQYSPDPSITSNVASQADLIRSVLRNRDVHKDATHSSDHDADNCRRLEGIAASRKLRFWRTVVSS